MDIEAAVADRDVARLVDRLPGHRQNLTAFREQQFESVDGGAF